MSKIINSVQVKTVVRPCRKCGNVPTHHTDHHGHSMHCACGNHVAGHLTKARAIEVWNWSNKQYILTATGKTIPMLPDTRRLNWLDEVTRRTNKRNATTYGWRFDINCNRAALTDSNFPARTIRQAIDEAMKADK